MSVQGSVVLADRYEVSGVLGVGGMGSVYRARDRELDELVALKMLRRELVAHPGMVERFRREVKLARRVTHRNVARVFDIGDHGGEKFITMELVEGESLGARLAREGRLSLDSVVSMGSAIAEGLGAAHDAGVIHRDLKPDNVLLGSDGRVVITDFGIARAAAWAGHANRTFGMVLGTPDYMAPEQVESAANIDGRADLYALGVMLYEMLTGETPFKGDSPLAIVSARLLQPPPDPRAIAADVPDGLARIVMRLMARGAADRPANAGEVASALAALTLPVPNGSRGSLRPVAAGRAPQRLAVVPLATPTRDLAWLGYGFAELVADALDGRIGVDIRARGARLAEASHRDLHVLGDDLGVPLVVGGAIHSSDGGVKDLRLEMRLVNVRDRLVLWSRTFGLEARSRAFEAATKTADEIAAALLLGRREPIPAVADEIAVTSCLRARFEAATGGALGIERAIALYERAITRAPDDPWVNASYALAMARRLTDAELPGEADDATTMATLAAELAPSLAAGHLALAEVHLDRGRIREAMRATVVARSHAPSSPDVERLLGHLLLRIGDVEGALTALRSASTREVSPWRAAWDEARALVALGRASEAEALLDAAVELEPLAWQPWIGRARLSMYRGDRAACAAQRAQLLGATVANVELVSVVLDVGSGRAHLGSALAHLEALERATGASKARRAALLEVAVELAAFAGDHARAASILERSDGLLADLAWLDHTPLLDELRGSAVFTAARARARTAAEALTRTLRSPHDTLGGNA